MRVSGAWLLLALAGIAATPSGSQAAKKFSSPYVKLVEASAMAAPGERPAVMVSLANSTETSFWVRVRFPAASGGTPCDTARRVAPKGRAMFTCPTDTLLADTDYPFTVSVYLDSALTRAQDENSSSVRFRREDLAAFNSYTSSMTLPQTYEHVVHTKKLGFGAMFLPGGSGSRLVVNPDGLEYATGSDTIRIAAGQITGVREAEGGAQGPWVVVQYEVAGEKRTLGLRPSPTNGSASVENIRASLEQLFASTHGK
jgi:hypothetical protein